MTTDDAEELVDGDMMAKLPHTEDHDWSRSVCSGCAPYLDGTLSLHSEYAYTTPETTSSHEALTAWLAAVTAVQTPLAPAAMLALVEAMHTNASPEAILDLVEACDAAADAAHRAKWSLHGDPEPPPRKSIGVDRDRRELYWCSSVTTVLTWRQDDAGVIRWRAYVDGPHESRIAAMQIADDRWAQPACPEGQDECERGD